MTTPSTLPVPRLVPSDAATAVACPPLAVREWVGTDHPLTLGALRGRLVVIEAFQMLCPGCVAHGLPLAARIATGFDPADVQVLGLHTVFEHHDVQGTRAALEAFVHEYRLPFPVAIDAPGDGHVPRTMARLGLRGTPSLLVLDHLGRIRAHRFGLVDELQLGALLGTLLAERGEAARSTTHVDTDAAEPACTDAGCALPAAAPA